MDDLEDGGDAKSRKSAGNALNMEKSMLDKKKALFGGGGPPMKAELGGSGGAMEMKKAYS